MYYQLTNAVKRRLIRELQEAFRTHPVYEKITITNKFQLDEKTKYGIVVKGSSADQLKLSADNFLGTVYSRVSLANISGKAIEWVREDSANLIQQSIDDVSEQADGSNKLFELQHQHIVGWTSYTGEIVDLSHTDVNALSVYVDGVKVPVLDINPAEGLVTLSNPPPDGSLVKVSYYWMNIAPVGAYGVEVISENTFMVDPLLYKEPFSINTDSAKVAKLCLSPAISIGQYPGIAVFVDDVLVDPSKYVKDDATRTIQFLEKLEGGSLSVKLNGSTISAGIDYFLVKRKQSELLSRRTSGIEKILDLEFDTVIDGTLEVWIDDEKVFNYADPTDVFSPDKITYTLVDGYKVTFSMSLPPSMRVTASYYYRDTSSVRTSIPLTEIFDNSLRVYLPDASIIPKSVDVWVKGDLLRAEDFTFDAETNELVLYSPLNTDSDTKVSYYYSLESQGPFSFEVFGYNNSAIPGCVLSFARQGEIGSRQLVFVSDSAEVTALEYGGKFNTSFSLDVVALDPIQQEEITDLVAMYLLALKDKFDAEGLFLDSVSIQGESEEPYDENTTDQYYLASISVAFITDWHIRKNIPIKIRDTYVRLIASVYNGVDALQALTAPTLYPRLESPALLSERIG